MSSTTNVNKAMVKMDMKFELDEAILVLFSLLLERFEDIRQWGVTLRISEYFYCDVDYLRSMNEDDSFKVIQIDQFRATIV